MTTVREKILAQNKRRYRDVAVNGIGCVRIQSLTELERRQIAAHNAELPEPSAIIMLLYCAVDEDGNRLFCEEDLPALEEVDLRLLSQCNAEIAEHVFGEVEAQEDAVKN
jgi:hypothetical protein